MPRLPPSDIKDRIIFGCIWSIFFVYFLTAIRMLVLILDRGDNLEGVWIIVGGVVAAILAYPVTIHIWWGSAASNNIPDLDAGDGVAGEP